MLKKTQNLSDKNTLLRARSINAALLHTPHISKVTLAKICHSQKTQLHHVADDSGKEGLLLDVLEFLINNRNNKDYFKSLKM